ncbi:hypothetical protein ACVWZA_000538 [Sphingomonas sp. UYAg733]
MRQLARDRLRSLLALLLPTAVVAGLLAGRGGEQHASQRGRAGRPRPSPCAVPARDVSSVRCSVGDFSHYFLHFSGWSLLPKLGLPRGTCCEPGRDLIGLSCSICSGRQADDECERRVGRGHSRLVRAGGVYPRRSTPGYISVDSYDRLPAAPRRASAMAFRLGDANGTGTQFSIVRAATGYATSSWFQPTDPITLDMTC